MSQRVINYGPRPTTVSSPTSSRSRTTSPPESSARCRFISTRRRRRPRPRNSTRRRIRSCCVAGFTGMSARRRDWPRRPNCCRRPPDARPSTPAFSALADVYLSQYDYGVLSWEESTVRARAAATKALELDEDSAAAHTSLAHILLHEWQDRKSTRLNSSHSQISYAIF